MEKRKDYVTVFGDLEIIHIQEPLQEKFGRQAPTGISVIGRIRYLKANAHSNETFNTVAHELIDIWCYGLNIYPMTKKGIVSKLDELYNGKKKSKNVVGKSGFIQLLQYPISKRSANWEKNVKEMCEMLQRGFDIKTTDVSRIKILEDVHKVKMNEEEIKLYEDNCKIKSCSCAWNVPIKCQECPRQMYSTAAVDKLWQKKILRKDKHVQYLNNEKERQNLPENHAIDSEHLADNGNDIVDTSPDDDDFSPPAHLTHGISSVRTRMRSSDIMKSSEKTSIFPRVPLRYSKSQLNPKVMRAVIHCLATYKVSDNDLEGIIVDIANMIFDQSWVKCDNGTFDVKDTNSDSEDDIESNKRKFEPYEESNIPSDNLPKKVKNMVVEKKTRRVKTNINSSFPSRKTRRNYLRHGAILNLRHLGKKIVTKSEGTVVTWGFDDTTKAGGNKVFDIKASNITLDGDGIDRETFTTGFTPNISHSGQDQGTTMKYSLQTLAVLIKEEIGDNEFSLHDLMEHIDFFYV